MISYSVRRRARRRASPQSSAERLRFIRHRPAIQDVALLRFASSHLRRRGVLSVALGPDNYWTCAIIISMRPGHICTTDTSTMSVRRKSRVSQPDSGPVVLRTDLLATERNPAYRSVHHGRRARYQCRGAVRDLLSRRSSIQPLERLTLRAAAWLMGASGAGFVSLVGTTSNDLTSSLFRAGRAVGCSQNSWTGNEGGARLGFAASGLLAGLGSD